MDKALLGDLVSDNANGVAMLGEGVTALNAGYGAITAAVKAVCSAYPHDRLGMVLTNFANEHYPPEKCKGADGKQNDIGRQYRSVQKAITRTLESMPGDIKLVASFATSGGNRAVAITRKTRAMLERDEKRKALANKQAEADKEQDKRDAATLAQADRDAMPTSDIAASWMQTLRREFPGREVDILTTAVLALPAADQATVAAAIAKAADERKPAAGKRKPTRTGSNG
jgi:hypothetical protein